MKALATVERSKCFRQLEGQQHPHRRFCRTAREAAEAEYPAESGVAAILGLGLGICAAFFQERLDDTLKGTDDVERVLGLAAVGLIPLFHN